MATVLTLTPDWDPANRFDVVTNGTLLLSNTCGHDVRWTRTPDSITPATDPLVSAILRPGTSISLRVGAGNAVWLTARPHGTAVVEAFP